MSYGTAANVRSVSYLITTALIADADVLSVGDTFAQPEVDAALTGLGAPFTTVPSIVVMVWSLLAAAHIYRDRLSHRDDAEGAAGGLRKQAADILEQLRKGTLSMSGITSVPLLVISDPTLDMPETAVIVGDPLDWLMPTETRE
jgi:hypothetical protein